MMSGCGLQLEPLPRRMLRWGSAAAFVLLIHAAAIAVTVMAPAPEPEPDDVSGAVVIDFAEIAAAPASEAPEAAPGPTAEEAPATREVLEHQPELEPVHDLPAVEEPLRPPAEPKVALPVARPVVEVSKVPEREEPAPREPEQQISSNSLAAEAAHAAPKVDAAPQASAASAPRVAISHAQSEVRDSWRRQLATHVNGHKRYPAAARRKRLQGAVEVAFAVDRMGRIVSARIVRSSGADELDHEALAVLARASPLPPPPDGVPGETFDLLLPMRFQIR